MSGRDVYEQATAFRPVFPSFLSIGRLSNRDCFPSSELWPWCRSRGGHLWRLSDICNICEVTPRFSLDVSTAVRQCVSRGPTEAQTDEALVLGPEVRQEPISRGGSSGAGVASSRRSGSRDLLSSHRNSLSISIIHQIRNGNFVSPIVYFPVSRSQSQIILGRGKSNRVRLAPSPSQRRPETCTPSKFADEASSAASEEHQTNATNDVPGAAGCHARCRREPRGLPQGRDLACLGQRLIF